MLWCKFSNIAFSFIIWLQILLWQYCTLDVTTLLLLFLMMEFKKNSVSEDGNGRPILPAVKPVE